jgi:hypothetical protein
MREVNPQAQTAFLSLRAAYQTAWDRYLAEVSRWQSLQTEAPPDGISLGEAERTAGAAEEEYRQARNLLADYMLEHSSRESVLINSKSPSPMQSCAQSVCFNHA